MVIAQPVGILTMTPMRVVSAEYVMLLTHARLMYVWIPRCVMRAVYHISSQECGVLYLWLALFVCHIFSLF